MHRRQLMWPPPPHVYSQYIPLPNGWVKECVKRPNGKSKGWWDFTLRPPTGKKLRRQSHLRDYLRENPGVSLDAAVFNFDTPWSTGAPPANPELIADADPEIGEDADPVEDANPDLIEDENPRSPEQSPRLPRGRNSGRRLSQTASRNLVTDIYVETQQWLCRRHLTSPATARPTILRRLPILQPS